MSMSHCWLGTLGLGSRVLVALVLGFTVLKARMLVHMLKADAHHSFGPLDSRRPGEPLL